MGKVSRKRHSAEFKARVLLEAIGGEQTLAEIGAKHGVHLTMVEAQQPCGDGDCGAGNQHLTASRT